MNLSSLLKDIPARYAKFLASLVGQLVVYLQLYGATWHLVPAVIMIAAALGIMATPNKAATTALPAPAPPVAPPGA